MAKYHVELRNGEIVVFRDDTIIAETFCDNLYPTTEANDADIDTLIDIANYYGSFYIAREV